MKFKKELIAITTCVVVLVGVLVTVNFIGKNEKELVLDSSTNSQSQNKDAKEKTKIEDNKNSEKLEKETSNPSKEEKNIDTKEKEEKSSTSKSEETKEGVYTIKKNDTLYSIANAYMPNFDSKEVIDVIVKRNNLKDETSIISGQQIVIPYEVALESKAASKTNNNDKNITGVEYKVKKGDSLYSIAKDTMPDTSVNKAVKEIKEHNKIANENSIKIGDVLYIPSK